MIKGVIFDFDGVIVHSESLHEKAWIAVLQKKGFSLTKGQFLAGFGLKNERFIREILQLDVTDNEMRTIIEEKEALFQEIIQKESIRAIEGVEKLIHMLVEKGFICAVGSSSIYSNIEIILKKLNLFKYFQAITSAEDVKEGKPSPEVFLRCAEKVGLPPEECLVFEDAPLGIEAAKRASMQAVAITTTFPREVFEKLSYKPDRIIPRYEDISLEAGNFFNFN